MKIFITGGSGLIGSAIVGVLVGRGDDVRALARSDESAATVEGLGATAVRGGVAALDARRDAGADAEPVIHVASRGDETSAEVEGAAAEAMQAGLRDGLYVHT